MAKGSLPERSRIALAAALTISLLWIAMAGTALWSAARGLANGRPDWALGWGLVGVLLAAAGAAAAVGTWWHLRAGGHGE